MIEQKRKRYKTTGAIDIFSKEAIRSFYKEIIKPFYDEKNYSSISFTIR